MRVNKFNKSARGFTLVELLIAMTLGVFMMTGVLSVFYHLSKVMHNKMP
ncbi:PilW family protein [Psychromonas sp. KJ10-10]